jgi:hypothetical protein
MFSPAAVIFLSKKCAILTIYCIFEEAHCTDSFASLVTCLCVGFRPGYRGCWLNTTSLSYAPILSFDLHGLSLSK